MMAACLTEDDLARFHAQEMAEAERSAAEAHISGCEICAERLAMHDKIMNDIRGLGPDAIDIARAIVSSPLPPERIGRYRIIRRIGAGGMGTVYEAEQESPKRTVALKVIKADCVSQEALRRFKFETEALGKLQHEGIAQIFEAGTFEAERGIQPFFAMELITGKPLIEHASHHELSTRQRLGLIAKICDAVHHAHQRGVIHRDLKPGNIIVNDAGQPKILDFGVARTTDSDLQATTRRTNAGQLIGTIPYMSPEQFAADPNELDTRSDVYALGVVAYELLAGKLPYDLSKKKIIEAARVIHEDDPRPLSSVNPVFRGDIETIIARAIEKDKTRRYQSAEALGRDVQHFLSGEPIDARRDSTWYVIRKLLRRYRVAASMATAFVVLLVVSTIALGVMYQNQSRAREEAEQARTAEQVQRRVAERREDEAVTARREAEQARDNAEVARQREAVVVRFVTEDMFSPARLNEWRETEPDLLGIMEVWKESALGVENDQLRHTVTQFLGLSFLNLGRLQEAEELLKASADSSLESYGEQHFETASAYDALATCMQEKQAYDLAEQYFRRALKIRLAVLPSDHEDIAASTNNLALLLLYAGRLGEAEALCSDALARAEEALGRQSRQYAQALHNHAGILETSGDLPQAKVKYEESLQIRRAVDGRDGTKSAETMINLATVEAGLGNFPRALELLDTAIGILSESGPRTHRLGVALSNMAGLLLHLARHEEAAEAIEDSIDVLSTVYGSDHPSVYIARNTLAVVYNRMGRHEDAEALNREILSYRRNRYGEFHDHVAGSYNNLAFTVNKLGQTDEAESLHRKAAEIYEKLDSPERWGVNHAVTLINIAGLVEQKTDFQEAEALYRQALEMVGQDSPYRAMCMNNLARMFDTAGQYKEAVGWHRQALARRRVLFPESHPDVDSSQLALAESLTQANLLDEARKEYEAFLVLRRRTRKAADPGVAEALARLGAFLVDNGDASAANPLLIEAAEVAATQLPPDHWLLGLISSAQGMVASGEGRSAEAETMLLRGIVLLQATNGRDHRLTVAAVHRLIEHAETHGKDQMAQDWKDFLEGEGPLPTEVSAPDREEP